MTLDEKISACIALYKGAGDNDFALSYLEGGSAPPWHAEIGNTCRHVKLGEAEGEYSAWGQTADEAVSNLLSQLQQAAAEVIEAKRITPKMIRDAEIGYYDAQEFLAKAGWEWRAFVEAGYADLSAEDVARIPAPIRERLQGMGA